MSALPNIGFAGLRRVLLAVGFAGLAAFGTGCESSSLTSAEGITAAATGASGRHRYEVAVERAPFYTQGPAQGYGPDASLVQGTVVRMIERKYGYSQVSTSFGDGWMATADLKPAPPLGPEPYEFADASPGSDTRSPATPASSDEPVMAPPEELMLPEPEPMPEPTEPQPAFRY